MNLSGYFVTWKVVKFTNSALGNQKHLYQLIDSGRVLLKYRFDSLSSYSCEQIAQYRLQTASNLSFSQEKHLFVAGLALIPYYLVSNFGKPSQDQSRLARKSLLQSKQLKELNLTFDVLFSPVLVKSS